MSFHTGQENRDLGAHKLGAWYELPHNEVPFMLLEPPQRVYKSELHTGPALLMDGRVVVLAWPPWTKLRPGPIARLLRRIGRALRLVAPRPLPPAELRAGAPELPPVDAAAVPELAPHVLPENREVNHG